VDQIDNDHADSTRQAGGARTDAPHSDTPDRDATRTSAKPSQKAPLIAAACLLLMLLVAAIAWPGIKSSSIRKQGLEGILIRGPSGCQVTINGRPFGRVPVRLGADDIQGMIAPISTLAWPGFGVERLEGWEFVGHSSHVHADGTHVFMLKTPAGKPGTIEVRVQGRSAMYGANYCSQIAAGYGPPDRRIVYRFD
jgi:hypothetical protein